jgi:dTDP-4-dehydrorhamnose reductase
MDKVLILGSNGMLGNAVKKFFPEAEVSPYRFPSLEFRDSLENYDFIINCIGAIPQKHKDFSLNTSLPYFLEKYTKAQIFHPATDCESDDSSYGISKKIASDWILAYGQRTTIIKSSIIGIEKNSNDSLLSWVLSQKGEINGYTSAKWNGITTLKWAEICQKLMKNGGETLNCYRSECISKFDLLSKIKKCFNLDIEIKPISGIGSDKCIIGEFTSSIETQLAELKAFYE